MLDRFARRSFGGIIALLLMLMAYCHARAVRALVTARLLDGVDDLGVSPNPRTTEPLPPIRRGAEAILARNPFDSATGPLPGQIDDEPVQPVHPLVAPKCDGVRVESTAVATDPLWSSAIVQGPGSKQGEMLRVGDAVGELVVAYIGYNSVEASPAVWLEDEGSLCQAYVFDAELKEARKKRTRQPQHPKTNESVRPARRGPPPLPDALAKKIERVSATEFRVDRSAVDRILERQAQLMKSVRIRPNERDGKVTGLTVSRVRPDTLLGKLGLRDGDQIQSLNGYSLASPERALEAYSRVRTASDLELQVVRGGKPVTIEYRIE